MANQLELFNTVESAQESETWEPMLYLGHKLSLPHADITLYPHCFSIEESHIFFKELKEEVGWRQDYMVVYGRRMPIPRQTAWYGDEGISYTYSGIEMLKSPWIAPLLEIKKRIESVAKVSFNSVLLNLYRDGKDSVAWHSDDEPELGEQPVIGSVSFGATRVFKLKLKDKNQQIVEKITLTNGSFLLMRGETQKYWLHEVPKTSKIFGPRVNLTFRSIYY